MRGRLRRKRGLTEIRVNHKLWLFYTSRVQSLKSRAKRCPAHHRDNTRTGLKGDGAFSLLNAPLTSVCAAGHLIAYFQMGFSHAARQNSMHRISLGNHLEGICS